MTKIRSVKPLTILLFLLLLTAHVTAITDILYDEPYSGHLTDTYLVTRDWNYDQIAYQKFKTNETATEIYSIQLYIPSNITSPLRQSRFWGGYDNKYIRIGVINMTAGNPVLTPAEFYAASLSNKFKAYDNYQKYYDIAGGFYNFTLTKGDTTLDPETEYAIVWYVFSDGALAGDAIYNPRGSGAAGFGEWSIHRGNVTNTDWNETYGAGYNLSFIINGIHQQISHIDSGPFTTGNTTHKFSVLANLGHHSYKYWTYGLWLGNVSTDPATFETNLTLEEHSQDMFSWPTFSDLEPGKFYHIRAWIVNDSYPFVTGDETRFLTNPDPPSTLTVESRGTNETNMSWDAGSSSEAGLTYVLFKSSTDYVIDPTNPGDASIVYNGTDLYSGNFSSGTQVDYYTLYSYIEATEEGETLAKFSETKATAESTPPAMDYLINVYNEKPDYGLATVDDDHQVQYEFATKDHEVLAQGNSSTNSFGVYSDAADILTIRYNLTATGPIIERCYVLTRSDNYTDRNLSVYVPNVVAGDNKSETRPVLIFFRDKTGGKFAVDQYAVGTIRKSVQNQTITIHSDYLQADNALRTYLVTGDQYYFYAKSDTLSEVRLGGILVYEEIYTIEVTTESIENLTWRQYVDITSGWSGEEEQTIWLRIYDAAQGLYETRINLYNADGDLLKSSNYTTATRPKPYNLNFTYNTGSEDRDAYWANIYMKYHKAKLWWNSSTNYFWDTDVSGIEVDMDTLDTMLTLTLGESPVHDGNGTIVSYSILIITAILIVFFFLIKAELASFALILIGFIMAALKVLGVVSETVLSTYAVSVIIFIGVLVYLITRPKKKKEEESP